MLPRWAASLQLSEMCVSSLFRRRCYVVVAVVNDVGNVVDIQKRRQTKLSTIDGFLISSLLKYLKQKSLYLDFTQNADRKFFQLCLCYLIF